MCFLCTMIFWLCLIRWHSNRIQCKLKCCNRVLACREYWCFYMNMNTKLSVLKYWILCYVYMFMFFRVLYLKVRSDILLFNEMSKFELWVMFNIRRLTMRVFETRTVTGSELFSLLTCPHTTTFTLLSIFSPLKTSAIKILQTILS